MTVRLFTWIYNIYDGWEKLKCNGMHSKTSLVESKVDRRENIYKGPLCCLEITETYRTR